MHSKALTTYAEYRGPQMTSADLAMVLGGPQSQQLPPGNLVESTTGVTSTQTKLRSATFIVHTAASSQSAAARKPSTGVLQGHPSSLSNRATTGTLFPALEPARPIVVPPLTSNTERFHLLQLWEGVVQEVRGDSVLVTLIDQTHLDYPDEEAEIAMAEIPEGDRHLVVPGAVLYWSVGYREGPGQPRERVSRIRFRRLPAWSKTDLDRAHANAQELARLLGSD